MSKMKDKNSLSVIVPEPFQSVFTKAEDYVKDYFLQKTENPRQGTIEISGERYILIRAASLSTEFFDMVFSLYRESGDEQARSVAYNLLFDLAHSIGKADAKAFHSKTGVTEPIEKLSAGPVHFAYTGWALVKIFPESNPTPDENYYLIYDHPFSFESEAWLKNGKQTDFPVCIMNAGYSSGWCAESFGIPLVATEIECRARGDKHCRFIMAPSFRIEEHIEKYKEQSDVTPGIPLSIAVPEFFRRKRVEEELDRTVSLLQATFDATADGILVLDDKGKITGNNKQFAAMWKIPETVLTSRDDDQALGFVLDQLKEPEAFLDKEKELYNKPEAESFDTLVFKDGRVFERYSKPQRIGDRVVGRVWSFRDITERRRASDELRESERKYRLLAETSIDFIFHIDKEGVILYCSPALEEILGYSKDEVEKTNFMNYIYPSDLPKAAEALQSVVSGKRLEHFVLKTVSKQRNIVTLEINVAPLMEKGNVEGLQGVARDITQRKIEEEERERLISELRDALGEVKALSGLLPICSSCKKIRDDKGYWKRIESYIQAHSEAEFSHGICPDCAGKLYPDFAGNMFPDSSGSD